MRHVLKRISVGLALVPVGAFVFILIAGVVLAWLGKAGHPVGTRYVVRYVAEQRILKIYRDKNYWVIVDLGVSNQTLVWGFRGYGTFCLIVATFEGVARFTDRRDRRRAGFEVIAGE